MNIDFKKKIDNILLEFPNNYLEKFSLMITKNQFDFLGFCLGYLPYSICEEILLINYNLINDFSNKNWVELIQNIKYNSKYGKNTLRKFLEFHTSFTPENLLNIGLKIETKEFEKIDNNKFIVNRLTKDNPRIIRLYKNLGLSEKDILNIHEMSNGAD